MAGGGNNSGFTLGIRAPGQSYCQCLNANTSNYSVGGVVWTDNFLVSNDATGLLFGDRAEGSAGLWRCTCSDLVAALSVRSDRCHFVASCSRSFGNTGKYERKDELVTLFKWTGGPDDKS